MTLPAENIARLGLDRVSRVLPTAVAGGLAAKLTAAFVILVTAVLAFNGAINMALSYKEATTAAIEVQKEKAQAAAERVLQFVEGIEGQMGWTTRTEWARVSLEQRRYDFIRLLRQTPAITELYQIDGAGKEQLRLSRLEPDMIGSGVDYSQDPRFTEAVANKVWYGPVYFRRGSEPYMTLSIAHSGRNPGVTSAGVNLKLVWDVITSIRVGEAGYAYVTDANGKLVAHPDMSLVLRGTELGHLPEVALAATGTGGSRGSAEPVQVTGLDGRSVLRAHAVIPKLGWIVFVELPIRETMAPVWTSFYQTMALLVFGVLIAAILGAWLAGRTVGPIKKLQAGAERLGKGDLSQRVMVESKDEIGTLAQRFNAMAERIQDAQETLEAKVAARTRELSQSLEGLRAAQDRLIQSEKLASLGAAHGGHRPRDQEPAQFRQQFRRPVRRTRRRTGGGGSEGRAGARPEHPRGNRGAGGHAQGQSRQGRAAWTSGRLHRQEHAASFSGRRRRVTPDRPERRCGGGAEPRLSRGSRGKARLQHHPGEGSRPEPSAQSKSTRRSLRACCST